MNSAERIWRALPAVAAAFIAFAPTGTYAQGAPGQYQPPAPQAQNPVCSRLETQLASVERGGGASSRATMVRGAEDAVNRQQAEVDRIASQQRRNGCQAAGIFSIFTPQPPQCQALNAQAGQARGRLDQLMSDLQRAQSGGGNDMESQRQALIGQLAQNNCGPQYRAAAAAPQRGIFETIFGGSSGGGGTYGGVDVSSSGSFRTLCVRTCDGYYYPISFATNPSHFAEDENTCRNTCPNTEVALYSHRTNDDVRHAATIQGRRYVDLPTAFRYRQQFDPSCSCRKPGQSWADAMGQSRDRIGRGDIIVTDEKSKELSAPKSATSAPSRPATPASATPASAPPASQGPVRTVGPGAWPAR
jgi:hypothetical protein